MCICHVIFTEKCDKLYTCIVNKQYVMMTFICIHPCTKGSSSRLFESCYKCKMNITGKSNEMGNGLIPDYIAFTSLFLCSVVLAVGLLGNLMVIIVIMTSKVVQSSTNIFLLNLSMADMLVLATCTPTTMIEIVTRKSAWYMGKVCDSYY